MLAWGMRAGLKVGAWALRPAEALRTSHGQSRREQDGDGVRRSAAEAPCLVQCDAGRPGTTDGAHSTGDRSPRAGEAPAASRLHRAEAGRGSRSRRAGSSGVRGGGQAQLRQRGGLLSSDPSRATDAADRARARGCGPGGPPSSGGSAAPDHHGPWWRRQDPTCSRSGRALT